MRMAFLGVFLVFAATVSADPIDWAQPPVGCVEELAPKDTPDRAEKIDAIYAASETQGMPPQVLYGAFMQEAYFSNLGISADGDNYSCGIGQLNVREWCEFANSSDAATKAAIEWPSTPLPCDRATMTSGIVKPFYEIAKSRAPHLKDHERGSEYYQGIAFASVAKKIEAVVAPVATDGTPPIPPIEITPEVVRARYTATSSFTRYCNDLSANIRAKALALRILFDTELPAPLQRLDTYAPGQRFARKCMRPNGKVYPLHTGWLTAVAMYNAGKYFLPRVASYYRWTKDSIQTDAAWAGFNPVKLILGLHGGGKYNPETQELNYLDLDGNPIEASWYKACIVQQHVERVVRYAALPGIRIAPVLEPKCTRAVPPQRQASSGYFDQ